MDSQKTMPTSYFGTPRFALFGAVFGSFVLGVSSGCERVASKNDVADDALELPPAGLVAQESSLYGTVTLLGGRPKSVGAEVDVGANPFCSSHGVLIDPTWKVTTDGGLADVVIAVKGSGRASNLGEPSVLIDQKNCQYVPTVATMQTGQSLVVRNSDLTFHNVRLVRHELGSRSKGENLENIGQGTKGDELIRVLSVPGVYRLECDIHRWMKAWIWVHEGIHSTVSGSGGGYVLNRALADGEYVVTAWHSQFPEVLSKSVQVINGKAEVDFTFDLSDAFSSL